MKPTKKDLIKCVVYTLLYLLFLYWVESFWGLLVLPLIFDAYITKHQMGLVEETEKYDGAQSYGLGRRDRLCLGGRLLSQSIFLSELRHPFFFFGEDDAHGRLPFSK